MASIHVSSANRTSGDTNDFRWVAPQSLEPGPYDIDNIQLTNGCYNVSSNNNEIKWTEFGQSQVTSTVAVGNYDQDTILAAIKAGMEADADGAVITVTYDETGGKLTIASTANILINTSGANSLLPYLGFNDSTTSYAASVVSDGILALDYPTSIFLKIDDFSGCISTNTYGHYAAQVPMTSGFGGVTLVKQQEYASRVVLHKTLRQIRVRLYDAQDRLIENNNANCSFTLRRL